MMLNRNILTGKSASITDRALLQSPMEKLTPLSNVGSPNGAISQIDETDKLGGSRTERLLKHDVRKVTQHTQAKLPLSAYDMILKESSSEGTSKGRASNVNSKP